jgi:hypothetical protein
MPDIRPVEREFGDEQLHLLHGRMKTWNSRDVMEDLSVEMVRSS